MRFAIGMSFLSSNKCRQAVPLGLRQRQGDFLDVHGNAAIKKRDEEGGERKDRPKDLCYGNGIGNCQATAESRFS